MEAVSVFRALPPDRAICAVQATGAMCEVRLREPVPLALYPAFAMRPLRARLEGPLRWDPETGALEATRLLPP